MKRQDVFLFVFLSLSHPPHYTNSDNSTYPPMDDARLRLMSRIFNHVVESGERASQTPSFADRGKRKTAASSTGTLDAARYISIQRNFYSFFIDLFMLAGNCISLWYKAYFLNRHLQRKKKE